MSDNDLSVLSEIFEQLKDDQDVNEFEAREKLGLQHREKLRSFVASTYTPVENVTNNITAFPYQLAINETSVDGKGQGYSVLMSRTADKSSDRSIYFLVNDKYADTDAKTFLVVDGEGKSLASTDSIKDVKEAFLSWFFKDMSGRDKRTYKDALTSVIAGADNLADYEQASGAEQPIKSDPSP